MKGTGHDSNGEKYSKNHRKRKIKETIIMRQINAKTSSSILCFFFMCFISSSWAFEKLPEKYTVSLGTHEAKHTVVEYFSLSCPLCLKLIKKDFKEIYTQFIANGKMHWIFHPDPADLSTLQLMVCLERLPYSKKWSFFWEVIQAVKPNNPSRNTFLLQELSKQFGLDVPLLHDIKWLESTEVYQEAFKYTRQADAPTEIPLIEFDGTLREDLIPTFQVIEDLTCR